MSSASVTSSKRENATATLRQELESIRAMNSSLQAYLSHLRMFKKNLHAMNENFEQLSIVNKQWIDHFRSKK